MARKKIDKYRLYRRFLYALATFVALAGAAVLIRDTGLSDDLADLWKGLGGEEESTCCDNHQILADHNVPLVAFVVRDIWRDGRPGRYALPERMRTPAQAVYVGLVSDGSVKAETWVHEGTVLDALSTGINRVRGMLTPAERPTIDSIEIFLGHSFRRIDEDDYNADVFSNRHRGIRALELEYDDEKFYFTPIDAIRKNIGARRFVTVLAEGRDLDPDDVLDDARLRIFDGEQLLITLGRTPEGHLMERGNTYVPINEVTPARLRTSIDQGTAWLKNNMNHAGRLSYGYLPSKREPRSGNNMIRQWMATIALGRSARVQLDHDLWEKAERNLRFNLDNYFHREGDLGVIYDDPGDVRLGAIALAGLAIVEHHNPTRYRSEEQALRAAVDYLWQPDGSFRTFLRPESRTDNQNFYPGESLNLWAEVWLRDRDPALLDRIMTTFRYYRAWHLDPKNRNPAFVPWHTQAYVKVWKETRDEELKDFVFEMNDWLLGVQQWGIPYEYRDTMGRFYDPGRPFGPPHASATGVYLEGLIDAFELARLTGDREREESYRLAILRGLRSSLQLQFTDDVDMFYMPRGFRKYVYGAFRTTVYNNAIRVDNVQHIIMAMIKILRVFKPEDYVYPEDRL